MDETNQPMTPPKTPFKKETMDHMQSPEVRSGARVFGWVVVIVLILGAFVAGYYVREVSVSRVQPQTTATSTTPQGTDASMSGSDLASASLDLGLGDVAWEIAPVTVPVTLFTANMLPEKPHTQLRVGTITKDGAWKGDALYLVRADGFIDGTGKMVLRVIKHGNTHVILSAYSDDMAVVGLGDGEYLKDNVEKWKLSPGTVWNDQVVIDEFQTSDILVTKKDGVQFAAASHFRPVDGKVRTIFSNGVLDFDIANSLEAATVGVTYGSKDVEISLYREKKTATGEFYMRMPDGTAIGYSMVVPFLSTKDVASITWNDGSPSTAQYTPYVPSGCGMLAMMISDDTIPSSLYVKAGVAAPGMFGSGEDTIYEYSDRNTTALKDFFAQYHEAYDYQHPGTTLTYTAFLKMHPIIFWKDQYGRLYQLHNTVFQSMVECGKPVVYLYPEKTQRVNVQVQPTGGFSVTEPTYPTGGWDVVAEPTGRLTDVRDNKTWGYLFWEGRGTVAGTVEKRGFVVSKTEVPAFLERTLTSLGLNTQERKDFTEFWVPRMQTAPFYFVTFYGNSLMNRIAPMAVTPRPDTTIRILMDYQPLTERKNVEPLPIVTPVRKGFTVVEWGGVLR